MDAKNSLFVPDSSSSGLFLPNDLESRSFRGGVYQDFDTQWITVFVEVNRRIAKTLIDKAALTVSQYRILFELFRAKKGLPGSLFSKLLLLNHSSITGALNGLERHAYISREATINNKRAITVTLLEDGEKTFLQASRAIAVLLDEIWRNLTPDQVTSVIKSTYDVVSTLLTIEFEQYYEKIPSYYVTAIVYVNNTWVSLLKEEYRISLTEFRILLQTLNAEEKNRGIDLASALILDTSMVSMAISKLEKMTLVARSKDRFDRRNYHVALTEKGRTVVLEARNELLQINRSFYKSTPLTEQEKLRTITSLIYQSL